jgi:hypothetical protein
VVDLSLASSFVIEIIPNLAKVSPPDLVRYFYNQNGGLMLPKTLEYLNTAMSKNESNYTGIAGCEFIVGNKRKGGSCLKVGAM